MTLIDGIVLAAYLLGMVALGLYVSGRNKSSEDMFAAGGQSPWWVAGLSGFMTIMSAGTFVVWGGLAYREGVVAISIVTVIGFSALAAGYLVAGRWRELEVSTPAEFVELRFGRPAVQIYTWIMMAARILSSGVALYAVSVMLVALVHLPEGAPFRDASSGQLSLPVTIVGLGFLIVAYTVAGGLWAVLLTDVVQFIVLQLAVLFVIPLLIWELYVSPSLAPVPAGYFSPVSDQYGVIFLAGWALIHFFVIGAEWAFAQRFICVPSREDARKGAYLFGALYLVSPTLWLAPAIIYRQLNGDANPEQAYVLASQAVLPAGMLGLMVAAMFSATASTVSGQINVFAGVLTEQFYRRAFGGSARKLVAIGRLFSAFLGIILIGFAVAVPSLGGAEAIILSLTGMLFGPLMAPTVWGLLSGKIRLRAVIWTIGVSLAFGLTFKIGVEYLGLFAGTELGQWFRSNPRMTEVLVGAVVPVIVLAICHILERNRSPAWERLQYRLAEYQPTNPSSAGSGAHAGTTVSLALCSSGVVMLLMIFFNSQGRIALAVFGSCLLTMGLLAAWIGRPRSGVT